MRDKCANGAGKRQFGVPLQVLHARVLANSNSALIQQFFFPRKQEPELESLDSDAIVLLPAK